MDARPALTRRSLIAATGAVLLAACGKTQAPGPSRSGKLSYGRLADQYGILGQPAGKPIGLVVLIHGGFWLQEYGADLMEPIAADLRRRGYATWNLEYRRVGGGGGYPATFEDVAAGIDHVARLGIEAPVTVVGHSAGGHLAVWAASRSDRTPGARPTVRAENTIALSGVLDLRAADSEQLGQGAARVLMGDASPGQLTYADPIQLVPAYGSISAVHARADQNVPLSQSRSYVDADLAAGGAAGLFPVPGDHFDLIDPGSAAWAKVTDLLDAP